jgi:hypothetical protein
MFSLLWNMTANDTFNKNELGQVRSVPPLLCHRLEMDDAGERRRVHG